MATAKKAVKQAVKKASVSKTTARVAKVATQSPVKKAAARPAKAPAKKTVAVKTVAAKRATSKTAASSAIKPVKETFTKASLPKYLAEQTTVDVKTVKTVLDALENTILGSVHKRGAGAFTLPGLMKISAEKVAAKKRRFGKDPFTGQERWFDAKPASVRIKARALKKLKDAAL